MTKTVLLVEDYEDTRAMMRIMIEQFGYSVIEAAGAYEALEKAETELPDLILMDIGLPLLDGLSTAQLIRRIDTLDKVPIIAVTAYSDVRDQVLQAGCSEVLYKPIQDSSLKRLLDIHLAGH